MRKGFRIGVMILVTLVVGIQFALAAVCPNCGYNNKEGYKYCI